MTGQQKNTKYFKRNKQRLSSHVKAKPRVAFLVPDIRDEVEKSIFDIELHDGKCSKRQIPSFQKSVYDLKLAY